ncbi:MAG: PTS sugar transporter subunit IIA [Nitrospinota bacterium]
MRLTNLLTVDTIIADLKATDKENTIREMVERLHSIKLVNDKEKIEQSLLEREKLGSTGIGSHVAIPHAKCDDIEGITAMFGKSVNGIEFSSLDDKKVHYVFLLLAPQSEAGNHLKLLARISRLVKTDGFTSKLKEMNTPAEILEIFSMAEHSL